MSRHRVSWRLVTAVLVLAPTARAAGAPSVSAGGHPDTAVYVLPLETIVTAARQGIPLRDSPAATSVVGAERLARGTRGVSVDEALACVPGVRIDNAADGERVHLSIRGQGILTERGIRGIKVLLDELPLNDPTGTAPDLYDVDWSTARRVEILRGPAAALYGGGGSGGVINILTHDGSDGPFSSTASITGGSYGFYKASAEVGGTSGRMNYHMSLSRAAGDGYRDHNAFWSDNAYGKFRWTPNPRVEVEQVLGWTEYFEENAEGLNLQQVGEARRQANPDATPFDELYRTGRFKAGLLGRFGLAPGQTLRLAGCLRSTQYREPRPRELQRRQLLSPGATLQYDLDRICGRYQNHVSAGADLAWLSGRYDDIDNRLRDHPFKDGPDLTGRKAFHRATGRAGLAWSPTPRLGLFGNWGQGFTPPTTEELVNNPVTHGGFNQGLTSATSNGGELGARGVLRGGLSYELTGFVLDTQNDFDRYRISTRKKVLAKGGCG